MKTKIICRAFSLLSILILASCSPEKFSGDLGSLPKASFTVTPIEGEVNTFVLSSNSENAFYYKWDVQGNGVKTGQDKDTVYFSSQGTYTAKLVVLGKGGHSEVEQTITVENDDPAGCVNMLYGCSGSKTWVLAPAAGSLLVGDLGGAVWWSNSAEEVALRACTFNDEYTFTKDGDFIFDNKGDMRIEDEGGAPWPVGIGLDIECYPMSAIPERYQAWGSGNHKFVVQNKTLKVIGTGAFMGLYKAGDMGNSEAPEESITYTIVTQTPDKLVIRKAYDWGQWTFTFVPKESVE